jgi:sulfur relay (sulfurtransferase) complex TusBCD TusD component (DsrE family)
MSKYLFILNEAAYGNERSYNALRLAGGLKKNTECSLLLRKMTSLASTNCSLRVKVDPQWISF